MRWFCVLLLLALPGWGAEELLDADAIKAKQNELRRSTEAKPKFNKNWLRLSF